MSDRVTASRARELLSYDPDTGILRNRTNRGKLRAGDEAGRIDPQSGYRRIMIDYHMYRIHRLAFLLMTGRWPRDQIDHINGIRDDNRWTNLREIDRVGNNRNTKRRCTNKSGCVGVRWDKQATKWRAFICLNGHWKHLGYFSDKADAIAARKAAERWYGYHKNHGRPA